MDLNINIIIYKSLHLFTVVIWYYELEDVGDSEMPENVTKLLLNEIIYKNYFYYNFNMFKDIYICFVTKIK